MAQDDEITEAQVRQAFELAQAASALCVFDLETTDKFPAAAGAPTPKVLQLAARRYRWDPATFSGTLLDEVSLLLDDPTVDHIAPRAYATHRIGIEPGRPRVDGLEMLDHIRGSAQRGTGAAPRDAWTRLLRLADGAALMGHNILAFDIPFANAELARHGFRERLDPTLAIDTLPLARRLKSLPTGHYRLRRLAELYGIETDPSRDHDALADIETDYRLFVAMVPGLRDHGRRFYTGTPDQYKRRLGGLAPG